MTVTVQIVGAGVDTLYASARGALRDGLLDGFADMRGAAGERRDAVFSFRDDKRLEMSRKGTTWPELLWTNADPDRPVWRVEFQYRRMALTSFSVRSLAGVLAARQALWEYGTRWLVERRDGEPFVAEITVVLR